jgi:hypothetical protein
MSLSFRDFMMNKGLEDLFLAEGDHAEPSYDRVGFVDRERKSVNWVIADYESTSRYTSRNNARIHKSGRLLLVYDTPEQMETAIRSYKDYDMPNGSC